MILIALPAMMLLMNQVISDPLVRAADEAAQRLQAEELRFQLGASTSAEVTLRVRELTRARRAVALRHNAFNQVLTLFEEEAQIALRQLHKEERRFQLGASNDLDVTARRRNLLAVRRSAAEWKSQLPASSLEARSAARRDVKALLEDEIALAHRQLRIEEGMVDSGASTSEAVAKRRAEIADLEAYRNDLVQ